LYLVADIAISSNFSGGDMNTCSNK
jgi:hypothetical protein